MPSASSNRTCVSPFRGSPSEHGSDASGKRLAEAVTAFSAVPQQSAGNDERRPSGSSTDERPRAWAILARPRPAQVTPTSDHAGGFGPLKRVWAGGATPAQSYHLNPEPVWTIGMWRLCPTVPLSRIRSSPATGLLPGAEQSSRDSLQGCSGTMTPPHGSMVGRSGRRAGASSASTVIPGSTRSRRVSVAAGQAPIPAVPNAAPARAVGG